ncbi:peptidyl-tRNA hydrolase [[Candida] jaroonii]|uniref:Peptidyl-tRNA hydrolase n=1 Tax=[Candida] jaroonii TaxID=467808 RepID=A0ACA9YD75_9ASCO|nr:peptidyl-tRNA hydrolase [[Candida] jaroonii]
MIASIGNPEPEYTFTRHNVGHFALDKLIEDHWTNFKSFTKHRNLSRGVYSVSNDSNMSNILLFKSNDTLMNLQGDPIFTNWRNVKRMQTNNYSPALVILHDEIQLPLGKIQIRKQGTSARGHNGLRSIDSIMGKEYTKISIGVGKPPNKFVADYVLARFKRPEIETLTYDVMPQIVEVLEEMMKGKYIYEKSK